MYGANEATIQTAVEYLPRPILGPLHVLTSSSSIPVKSLERPSEKFLLQRMKEGRFYEAEELLARQGEQFPVIRRVIDAAIFPGTPLFSQDVPTAVSVVRALLQNDLANGSACHVL